MGVSRPGERGEFPDPVLLGYNYFTDCLWRYMMRLSAIGITAISMMACSTPDAMFEHQGQIMAEANGVVLSSNGDEGIAGMFGTTCAFNTANGTLGEDFDLPSEDEVVDDVNDVGLVLSHSSTGIHELEPFGRGFEDEEAPPTWQFDPGADAEFSTVEVEGVILARYVGDVVFALVRSGEECDGVWIEETPSSTRLPMDACEALAGVAVNADMKRVYLATPTGMMSVSTEGVSTVSDAALSHLSFDASLESLYALNDAGTVLIAMDTAGTVQWEKALEGEATALSHLGPVGRVVVMESDGVHGGTLTVHDGVTSELVTDLHTPSAGLALTASANGKSLAITVEQYIHLFQVHH